MHWHGWQLIRGLIKRVESSSRLNEIISFKGVVDRKRLLEAMSTAKCYLSMSRWEGTVCRIQRHYHCPDVHMVLMFTEN